MKNEQYLVGTVTTAMYYGHLSDMSSLYMYKNALWVTDENTSRFVPDFADRRLEIPSGEENKNIDSITKIIDEAIRLEFGRDDVIVGLGGGVICDMAGFAASIYMRGCRAVLIPSTLLAMNDASLGGKTGIDYTGYKNLLGAFYPAEEIYVFSDIVNTLTERDYLSGLSEVIKHAFLSGKDFFNFINDNREGILNRNTEILDVLIPWSLSVKGHIVEKDAKEHGIRAYLNLGHTFGHALETLSGFSIKHGECVAWGIAKAMKAGVMLNITDPDYAEGVISVLKSFGYVLEYGGYSSEDLKKMMIMDKKKRGGRIRFVVQERIGKTLLTEIPDDILLSVLS